MQDGSPTSVASPPFAQNPNLLNPSSSSHAGPIARKRNRISHSCSECKRRKVKCSREPFPCEACRKRGDEHLCQPATNDSTDDAGNLHSNEEFFSLKRRLEALESAISTDPSLRTAFDAAVQPSAPVSTLKVPVDTDLEDAALVLEDMAFGARAQSNQSPVLNLSPTEPERLFPSILTESETTFTFEKAIYTNLIDLLPPQVVCQAVVSIYFDEVAWNWRVLHKPQFLTEFEEFCLLRRQNKVCLIDPAWLAVLSALVANTMFHVTDGQLESAGVVGDPQALGKKICKLSKLALETSNFIEHPSVRAIQAIMLYIPMSVFTWSPNKKLGFPGCQPVFNMWLSIAIKSAQALNFHQLGEDPTCMPDLNDKAFPLRPSSFARQLASRLWYSLTFMDWMKSRGNPKMTMVSIDDFNTDMPLNVPDVDLSFDLFLVPRPESEFTDMTPERIKYSLCRHYGEIFKNKKDGQFSYDTILQADISLRKTLDLVFQIAGFQLAVGNARIAQLMTLFRSGLYNQLLRLHRPYSARGYRDSRFEPSTRACLEAAHQVLNNLVTLSEANVSRYFFLFIHGVSACIALITALVCTLQNSEKDPLVVQNRAALQKGLDFLVICQKSKKDSLREGARRAHNVISSLVRREQEQRHLLAAGLLDANTPLPELFKSLASGIETEQTIETSASSIDTYPQNLQSLDGLLQSSFPIDFDADAILREMGLFPLQAGQDDVTLQPPHWLSDTFWTNNALTTAF